MHFPAYFAGRGHDSVENAGKHIIATGVILRHSGLKNGAWALEYGAGFGQTALALSRLGVNVDTVDISSMFCQYVQANADFFPDQPDLFSGVFGENPSGHNHKYDLIYFYEAFHHALDFQKIVKKIKNSLTPGGKIALCGEPIWRIPTYAVPYEWGMRLNAETVVVTRSRGWLELGTPRTTSARCSSRTALRPVFIPVSFPTWNMPTFLNNADPASTWENTEYRCRNP